MSVPNDPDFMNHVASGDKIVHMTISMVVFFNDVDKLVKLWFFGCFGGVFPYEKHASDGLWVLQDNWMCCTVWITDLLN